MVLTTYRRSGDPVHTTVWFAQVGDRLYVTTMNGAGKAKRIRNSEQVVVAPSDRMGTIQGPSQTARARVLAPDEFPTALEALRAKLNPAFDQMISQGGPRGGAPDDRIYLEIRPEETAIA